MNENTPSILIYTTSGNTPAFLIFPYLYNMDGEWLGWVTSEREVYSVSGEYVGYLTSDPRILCKRGYTSSKPRLTPPPQPPKARRPNRYPLPPLMSELGQDTIDIFDEDPGRLLPFGFGSGEEM